MTQPVILKVEQLVTTFDTDFGKIRVADSVSFQVEKGKTLGIVGESGCGKSVTALSIMRLLPKPAGNIEAGSIILDDCDLTGLSPDQMHDIRGNRISMIFQEPMTALNPVHRIGKQLGEVFRLHFPDMSHASIYEQSLMLLKKVGIPDPEKRILEYPHQISGGMRQRVMIGMALACRPDILIADEPTTALDVTIQAQILELMKSLQRETGMSIIFITHDLGVIAEMCDDVAVMYAGKIVESAQANQLFQTPRHPYTRGLLASIPRLQTPKKQKLPVIQGAVPEFHKLPPGCRFQNRCPIAEAICEKQPPPLKITEINHTVRCHFSNKTQITRFEVADSKPAACEIQSEKSSQRLLVDNLKMHFPVYGGVFHRRIGTVYAVDGISLTVGTGKTLGLVGESGCGKTTAGRAILRLYRPTSGQVLFDGQDLAQLDGKRLREVRKNFQIIFQDPFESLDVRQTVREILEEPFVIHKSGSPAERHEKIDALLEKVGLPGNVADRFPHEFSGGQRQRIGIARAIALEPEMIICDEPVSALDVSIQSQIINLLLNLQQDMGLSYLFIAHDLAVVKHISDHIAVMYLGKIVEYAEAQTLYEHPLHPYTQALIEAIPVARPGMKKKKKVLGGDVPSPIHPPRGCAFHTRCPFVFERCRVECPGTVCVTGSPNENHTVACHQYT